MSLQRRIIATAYRIKPVLFRVIPLRWLRAVKRSMIRHNFRKLEQLQLEPYQRGRYPAGVNLIGSIRAETGLGQSCRLLAKEIKSSRYPLTVYNYMQVGTLSQSDSSWDQELSEHCRYNVNVLHINPHELGVALMQLERSILDGRYNIGFWLWELEEFPDEWLPCLNYMNEIWTPSEFISNAIRKKSSIPVHTIPYAIDAATEEGFGREEFGLPEDKFLFLMMYDNNSISERKNPIGVITAFQKAFGQKDTQVGLVIKVSSPDKQEMAKLYGILAGYQNIYFVTESMEKKRVNSLIACVDVVISLHRAEGFGLVLAEAMYLGTPTIATNWSSNTEFMDSDVACMVDYQLVRLEQNQGPFLKGQRWADPNLDQAAEYMRRLFEEKDFYEQIASRAKTQIRKKLSMEQAVVKIEERLQKILQT